MPSSNKQQQQMSGKGSQESHSRECAVVPLSPRELISIGEDSEGNNETIIDTILKEQEFERFEILNFQERNTFVPISDPKSIASSEGDDFSFILPASLNTVNSPSTV